MINIVVWLIVGGFIGWLASIVMHATAQRGVLMNIVDGIVGASIAGRLSAPLFGISTVNQSSLSLPALLVPLLGAVILLAVVRFLRRGGVRGHQGLRTGFLRQSRGRAMSQGRPASRNAPEIIQQSGQDVLADEEERWSSAVEDEQNAGHGTIKG
jgi:uncharacterized membrane protein YeaQ/YmgE (transglycosylase-associated protein family)